LAEDLGHLRDGKIRQVRVFGDNSPLLVGQGMSERAKPQVPAKLENPSDIRFGPLCQSSMQFEDEIDGQWLATDTAGILTGRQVARPLRVSEQPLGMRVLGDQSDSEEVFVDQ